MPATSASARASAPFRFTSLLAFELVASRERPRPRNAQDVGVAANVVWKGREWRRHLHDLDGRRIEDPLAGLAVHFHLLDAAVGTYEHREDQAAVEFLAPCRFRIVHVADVLDLEPPVLDIAGEAIFPCLRTDVLAPRNLLVLVHVAGDLRFESNGLERLLHDIV